MCIFFDGLNDFGNQICGHNHLDFNLWDEIYVIFRPSVYFFVSSLPSKALHFGDCHAAHTMLQNGLFNLLQLKRFNNRFNLFHRHLPSPGPTRFSDVIL